MDLQLRKQRVRSILIGLPALTGAYTAIMVYFAWGNTAYALWGAALAAVLVLAGTLGLMRWMLLHGKPDGPVNGDFYPELRRVDQGFEWRTSERASRMLTTAIVLLASGAAILPWLAPAGQGLSLLGRAILTLVLVGALARALARSTAETFRVGPGFFARTSKGKRLESQGDVRFIASQELGSNGRIGMAVEGELGAEKRLFVDVPPFRNASRNELIYWLSGHRAEEPVLRDSRRSGGCPIR